MRMISVASSVVLGAMDATDNGKGTEERLRLQQAAAKLAGTMGLPQKCDLSMEMGTTIKSMNENEDDQIGSE